MKFFLYDQNNQNHIDTQALQTCDGYSFQYSIAQFFDMNSNFANANIIRAAVNDMYNQGKLSAISIEWGSKCGNVIWNNYSYLEMVTKNHKDSGQPLYNKFPVFTNEAYMDKVVSFLEWLRDELDSVIGKIDFIYVCGINMNTKEFRVPPQNWATTYDMASAYALAAQQWKNAGYTYNGCIASCERLLNNYNLYFPDNMKVSALIAAKNGFPCIDQLDMVCEYGKRPIINNNIIDYAKKCSNMAVMYTALSDKPDIPANFVNSDLPMYYQLNQSIYGNNPTEQQFEGALLNAQNHNGQVIEIMKNNVKAFPEIIKKYQMDQIDRLLDRIKNAVDNNIEGDGLGYIDWQELTAQEREKFIKEFEADGAMDSDGSGSFMKTYNGREFYIDLINYKV